MKIILVTSALVALLAPAVAEAEELTCLVGTDTRKADDRARIAPLRATIDAACVRASFDGSAGHTHGSYTACAVATIHREVALGHLGQPMRGHGEGVLRELDLWQAEQGFCNAGAVHQRARQYVNQLQRGNRTW